MIHIKIVGAVPPRVLAALFVTGVEMPLPGAMSVNCWLTRELGLDPEYVAREIGAAFLDGRPLDDFDTAELRPGAILALGAAVPGLVGISLNRGSPLACFRHDISQATTGTGMAAGQGSAGMVRLKLFNFPARALAAGLVSRGVVVTAGVLSQWSAQNAEELRASGVRFLRGERELDVFDAAAQGIGEEEQVLLQAG